MEPALNHSNQAGSASASQARWRSTMPAPPRVQLLLSPLFPTASRARGQSALTLFTRKPSLSTPSSMSPVQVSCPRSLPRLPPAPRKPLPPGDAPWRASSARASRPAGRKSDGVGTSARTFPLQVPSVPTLSRTARGDRPRTRPWTGVYSCEAFLSAEEA